MPRRPSEDPIITLRNAFRALFLTACLLAMPGCGAGSSDSAASSDSSEAEGEHFLSDQQRALEGSKAAAEAMEEAAAERARQTEDARND